MQKTNRKFFTGYLIAGLSVVSDLAKLFTDAPPLSVMTSLFFIAVVTWMYHVNVNYLREKPGTKKERVVLEIALITMLSCQLLSIYMYVKGLTNNPISVIPYVVMLIICVAQALHVRTKKNGS
jgi:hypothetical protein